MACVNCSVCVFVVPERINRFEFNSFFIRKLNVLRVFLAKFLYQDFLWFVLILVFGDIGRKCAILSVGSVNPIGRV